MKKAVSVLIILLIVCDSCKKPDKFIPAEYTSFLENPSNEMNRRVTYGDVFYSIQLATPEYVASKEFDGTEHTEEDFRKRLSDLKGYLFFYISIAGKRGSRLTDPKLVDERETYYAQTAAGDIRLKASAGDELMPVTYHFEDNYGLSPYNRILVAFKTENVKSGRLQLVFNDRFNGNYLIKSSFNTAEILELPTLLIQ